MISPLSISYALSMTANGASGRTRDSIMNVLRFGDLSIDGVNSSYLDLTEKAGILTPGWSSALPCKLCMGGEAVLIERVICKQPDGVVQGRCNGF
ncbi:MAG: serpin family protein [Bacteroidales bacterium]